MKKQFGKLFIIFGVILCIFALVGCDLIFVDTPEPEKNPAEESSSETVESSENLTEESGEKTTESTDPTDESSSEEESTDEETFEDIFEPDEELVEALVEYLEDIGSIFSGSDTYFKMMDQIDQINRGAQPLQIEFDPNKYYYICAYYTPEHLEEEDFYCCAAEYTWVGFGSEENISEYYNGTKLLVAIQINKTELCVDILYDDRNVPKVEYFQVYSPIFENGINTAESIAFDDKMIYLNSTDAPTVYIYSKHIIYDFSVMYYVKLDSRNYIVYDHTEHVENVANKEEFRNVFGNYYDQLIEIMITDKYFITNSKGENIYFGIFEIEEFFNTVRNKN